MFARATRGACYPGGGPRGHGCSSIGHQRGRRANSISGRSNDSRSERRLLVVCRLNVLGPRTLAYCLRGRRPCVFARPLLPSTPPSVRPPSSPSSLALPGARGHLLRHSLDATPQIRLITHHQRPFVSRLILRQKSSLSLSSLFLVSRDFSPLFGITSLEYFK